MLSILLKKQLQEIFRNYFYDPKKNRSRSKTGTILYFLLFVGIMAGILGGMFTFLSLTLCDALADAGLPWLYFTLLGLLSVFLGTFGSVFNTYFSLYMAKDNDLMLSMPIPVSTIMASRLLSVYLIGLMYSIVVILPAVIVYWVRVSASAAAIFGCLLLILLISIFVLTLSCALGWVVAKISLKLKNKSIITVIASLVFLGAYYFFYFKAQSMIQDLLVNAAVYGEMIKGAAYPLYLFGSVGVGDGPAMLIVSATVLALFALMWWLISRSFLKIATASGHTAKKVYRDASAKQKSIAFALQAKEFGRFISSPNYMLNCGLGILLMPIAAVLLFLKGDMVISMLNDVFDARTGCVPLLLCAGVCMMASMNDMAAPSVSLEGKSLWLIQSLPVTPWQVLRAKLNLQLLLTGIPVLLCLIAVAFICPMTPLELLCTILVPLLFVLLSSLTGMFLAVRMPNLSWTNEITPIKQSASVMIALFGSFLFPLLLCLGYMVLDGWVLGYAGYMGCFIAVSSVLSAVLFIWLRKKGCELFQAL